MNIILHRMPFYQMNGFIVSFVSNMQYLDVSKPADYSVEKKVEEILEPYIEAEEVDSVYPNIIVIMNEAFSTRPFSAILRQISIICLLYAH